MLFRSLKMALVGVLRLFKPRERFSILAMDRIAPRVVRIRLAPASGSLRPYLAGQFLFIRLDIPGLPRRTKPFTISNPPGDRYLEIMVKGSDDWTLSLYDLSEAFPGFHGNHPVPRSGKPGFPDGKLGMERPAPGVSWQAWLDYPYGSFTTKGADDGPWVFLAAGIGITPFLALAGNRLRDDARILILWAAHNRDELAGFDRLAAINARRPSVRLIPVLGHDPLWSGRQGRLDRRALEELAARELADPEARYWICCPAPLRRSLVKTLKSLGVQGKRIRWEVFCQ